MIAAALTVRPVIAPPSIARLYAILSPDRLAGVLASALDAAVREARENDPSYAPPCDPAALVEQAREGLELVWSEVEPALRAVRDGCASAGAAKAARDAAAHAEREREVKAREAQAAQERVDTARREREAKAAQKAARDRAGAEDELASLRGRLAALEAALAAKGSRS